MIYDCAASSSWPDERETEALREFPVVSTMFVSFLLQAPMVCVCTGSKVLCTRSKGSERSLDGETSQSVVEMVGVFGLGGLVTRNLNLNPAS